MNHRNRLLFVLALAWTTATPRAPACNIPVFRYALERWRPEHDSDRYQVYVFHKGPLSAPDQELVRFLQDFGKKPRGRATLHVEVVDLSRPMDGELRKLWQGQRETTLPWMVVRYPDSEEDSSPAWAGRLSGEAIRLLTDSPARREIARRILGGDAVVWVLLEGGDRRENEAVADLLGGELKKLEKTIRLPQGVGEDVKLLSRLPVRIRFSVQRVARTDPAEKLFVEMLRHTDPDFTEARGPIVFPVFGRGRVYDGLLGKGINPETIRESALYLCGACSCEVKRQNPGTDLLVAADWDSILDAEETTGLEEPETAGERVPISMPKADSVPAPAPIPVVPVAAVTPPGSPRRILLLVGVGAAGLLVAVTGVWAWRSRNLSTRVREP